MCPRMCVCIVPIKTSMSSSVLCPASYQMIDVLMTLLRYTFEQGNVSQWLDDIYSPENYTTFTICRLCKRRRKEEERRVVGLILSSSLPLSFFCPFSFPLFLAYSISPHKADHEGKCRKQTMALIRQGNPIPRGAGTQTSAKKDASSYQARKILCCKSTR